MTRTWQDAVARDARDPDSASPEMVDRRIRNRIIECLEIAADAAALAEFGAFSFINLWDDWVQPPIAERYAAPVFTAAEAKAIQAFHDTLDQAAQATDADITRPEELSSRAPWRAVLAGAAAALSVFLERGRLPED